MESKQCDYCGQTYATEDDVPSDDYLRHGHVLFDCPSPDKMERAWLNASPVERAEAWP